MGRTPFSQRTQAEQQALLLSYALWATAFMLAAVAALLGFLVWRWDTSLAVAVAILAAYVLATALVTQLWFDAEGPKPPAPSPQQQPQQQQQAPAPGDNPFADAAKLLITTQGVVLGLLAFAGPDRLSPTLKVGAASLAAGVLLACLLYMQVATGIPTTTGRYRIATITLTLTLWALGFGLVCTVTGNWST